MYVAKHTRLFGCLIAGAFLVSACGGGSSSDDAVDTSPDTSETSGEEAPGTTVGAADTSVAAEGDAETPLEGEVGSSSDGDGVILADLCAGGQPLNGAVSLEDLVDLGVLSSTDATIDGNSSYDASAYETFGFICNISEDTGEGENLLTIGVNSGSDIWDLAVEQGEAPAEQIGDWDVIVGSNWLSPLTMRTTDADGNQDSLFALWTTADGSIPDAATLERIMRPLAEAFASSPADMPRS